MGTTEVELELGECFEILCLRGWDTRAYQVVLELTRLGIRSLPAKVLLSDGECGFRVVLDLFPAAGGRGARQPAAKSRSARGP
jgi:hypothetical protein